MVLYSTPTYDQQQSQKFSGVLELIQTRNHSKRIDRKGEKVLVVVYKTSSNHFAVIYPLWGLDCQRKPICKINLLSTKVEKSSISPDREFTVVSTLNSTLISFTFRIQNDIKTDCSHTCDEWLSALSSHTVHKKSTNVYKSRQIRINLSVLSEVNEDID